MVSLICTQYVQIFTGVAPVLHQSLAVAAADVLTSNNNNNNSFY
jgi:hypothetical protein